MSSSLPDLQARARQLLSRLTPDDAPYYFGSHVDLLRDLLTLPVEAERPEVYPPDTVAFLVLHGTTWTKYRTRAEAEAANPGQHVQEYACYFSNPVIKRSASHVSEAPADTEQD